MQFPIIENKSVGHRMAQNKSFETKVINRDDHFINDTTKQKHKQAMNLIEEMELMIVLNRFIKTLKNK